MIDGTLIAEMRRDADDQWIKRIWQVYDQLWDEAKRRNDSISLDTLLLVAERIVSTERMKR